jgi:steroid delta-isomerase-like uncharacterized protein
MDIATQRSSPSSKQLVLSAFDALNRQDLAYVKQFWTHETVERFPDQRCVGADAIESYFAATFRALPDWHIEVVAAVEEGDDIFVRWHLTGTHRGPLLGVEATGARVAIDGIDHFVVRDGKVVSNTVVFDQLAFARQVGLMPPDGSGIDRTLKAGFNLKTRLAGLMGR